MLKDDYGVVRGRGRASVLPAWMTNPDLETRAAHDSLRSSRFDQLPEKEANSKRRQRKKSKSSSSIMDTSSCSQSLHRYHLKKKTSCSSFQNLTNHYHEKNAPSYYYNQTRSHGQYYNRPYVEKSRQYRQEKDRQLDYEKKHYHDNDAKNFSAKSKYRGGSTEYENRSPNLMQHERRSPRVQKTVNSSYNHFDASMKQERRSSSKHRNDCLDKYDRKSPNRESRSSLQKEKRRSPEREKRRSPEREKRRSQEREECRSLEKEKKRSQEKEKRRSQEKEKRRSQEKEKKKSSEREECRSLEKEKRRNSEKEEPRNSKKEEPRNSERNNRFSPERAERIRLEKEERRSSERDELPSHNKTVKLHSKYSNFDSLNSSDENYKQLNCLPEEYGNSLHKKKKRQRRSKSNCSYSSYDDDIQKKRSKSQRAQSSCPTSFDITDIEHLCIKLNNIKNLVSVSEKSCQLDNFMNAFTEPNTFTYERADAVRHSFETFKKMIIHSCPTRITRRIVVNRKENISYCIEAEWFPKKETSIISMYVFSNNKLIRCYEFKDSSCLATLHRKVDTKLICDTKTWAIIRRYLLKKGVPEGTQCEFSDCTTKYQHSATFLL